MEVQPRLHRLLRQLSPSIEVISAGETPAAFDYHCPMLSLPLAFGTTIETIPAEQHYLRAEADIRAEWSAHLTPKTKPRIGVVWSGSPAQKDDHNRSIDLATLLPLFSHDADFVCLQKELREHDAAVLRQCGRIAFFGDLQRDFSDAAALVDQMDLVITVCTSVAHLAAAVGKPVWVLLSQNPDWRWLLDRDDSPWYPTVRLFRQTRAGDWDAVVERVQPELHSAIKLLIRTA